MESFPEAKVVLTIRDPDAWYKSVKETIYQGNVEAASFPGNIASKIMGVSRADEMIQNLTRRDQNRFHQGEIIRLLSIKLHL